MKLDLLLFSILMTNILSFAYSAEASNPDNLRTSGRDSGIYDSDINSVNEKGLTALHLAAWENDIDATQSLLAHPNININALDRFGHAALHIAAAKGYSDIVKSLLAHPNIDVNITNKDGRTVLQLTVSNGYPVYEW